VHAKTQEIDDPITRMHDADEVDEKSQKNDEEMVAKIVDHSSFEESMVGMQRAECEDVFLEDGVVTDEVEATTQRND